VKGKGGKSRMLCLSKETIKALWAYLKEVLHEEDEPLFIADRGKLAGQPLTRFGLYQLIERLGTAAGIEACRCSPHPFRHTFAIEFLRNGGDVFTLQQMLGHTRLEMTMRYVAIAQADIQRQHRQHSPVEGILKRRY
jgi:integrase/recombinase XerD